MNDTAPLRVGLVGCGAIARHAHLPALRLLPQARATVLIDRDAARARVLADEFGVQHAGDDAGDLAKYADAAIIAVPNALHAPTATDLIAAGVHVLVEKPMALSVADCDAMIEAARGRGVTLAVGHWRRFRAAAQLVKRVLDAGMIGRVESFDVREGSPYNWPIKSDFFLRKDMAGGGVFMDMGPHVLDLLLWWLGEFGAFTYRDDAHGGVEADCLLDLNTASESGGASGVVELSRTRSLRNSIVLRGTAGELELPAYEQRVELRCDSLSAAASARFVDEASAPQSDAQVMAAQLADWIDAIRTNRPPAVTGETARRTMALIEACYAQRQPLDCPWSQPFVWDETVQEAASSTSGGGS